MFTNTQPVDSVLDRGGLPSPTGTFLLSQVGLDAIQGDPLLQTAVVLRILRYVSPKPWGSLQAQNKRRSESLSQLTDRLMQPYDGSKQGFTMGSQVFWQPVTVPSERRKHKYASRSPVFVGYRASRQPPYPGNMEMIADRDFTQDFLDAYAARQSGSNQNRLDILFDCRFVMRVMLDLVPAEFIDSLVETGVRLFLTCDKKWYQPRVVARHGEQEQNFYVFVDPQVEGNGEMIKNNVDWIHMKSVRVKSSL